MKFCKDCEFYRKAEFESGSDKCYHPEALESTDLVTANKTFKTAHTMRYLGTSCRKEGLLFKAITK